MNKLNCQFKTFEKGWSLGILYDNPAIPDHLKIMLQNRDHLVIYDLAAWLAIHNVQAIAYCTGGWKEKIKSYRFIRQFNRRMVEKGMLADLGDFYHVLFTKSREMKVSFFDVHMV